MTCRFLMRAGLQIRASSRGRPKRKKGCLWGSPEFIAKPLSGPSDLSKRTERRQHSWPEGERRRVDAAKRDRSEQKLKNSAPFAGAFTCFAAFKMLAKRAHCIAGDTSRDLGEPAAGIDHRLHFVSQQIALHGEEAAG